MHIIAFKLKTTKKNETRNKVQRTLQNLQVGFVMHRLTVKHEWRIPKKQPSLRQISRFKAILNMAILVSLHAQYIIIIVTFSHSTFFVQLPNLSNNNIVYFSFCKYERHRYRLHTRHSQFLSSLVLWMQCIVLSRKWCGALARHGLLRHGLASILQNC